MTPCAVGALGATAWALFVVVCVLPAGAQDEQTPATQPERRLVNLVPNGDFAQASQDGRLPAGWTTKHPDNVRLVAPDEDHPHAIEMTGDEKLMGSYGVDLTSDKIPIKPNTRYRCTGYTRSRGPSFMVFVKGFATVTRRVKGQPQTFDDAVYQMRKEIKPSADWQPFNLDFDITPADVFSDHLHEVQYVRITLWAYWPAGTGSYDGIRFEEVGPLPAGKVRRPDAVTHTGRPPNLGPRASQPDDAGAFDEEQMWLDAANALRSEEYAKAAALGEQLVARAPQNGNYRVLLARTLVRLERWTEADEHAAWLLDESPTSAPTQPAREIEPWQRDWALVVRAEVQWHAGRTMDARQLLQRALRADASPHARQAAEELLRRIESAGS